MLKKLSALQRLLDESAHYSVDADVRGVVHARLDDTIERVHQIIDAKHRHIFGAIPIGSYVLLDGENEKHIREAAEDPVYGTHDGKVPPWLDIKYPRIVTTHQFRGAGLDRPVDCGPELLVSPGVHHEQAECSMALDQVRVIHPPIESRTMIPGIETCERCPDHKRRTNIGVMWWEIEKAGFYRRALVPLRVPHSQEPIGPRPDLWQCPTCGNMNIIPVMRAIERRVPRKTSARSER